MVSHPKLLNLSPFCSPKQMENLSKQTQLLIFAVFFFVCLLSSSSASALASASYGDVDVDVDADEGYNYDPWSDRGPYHWGDLKPEWAACKNGKKQSPIALSSRDAEFCSDLGNLKRYHRPASATLRNKVHEVAVEWEGNAGSIRINGTDYFLQNYHWHHPSEHTQDGRRFPLELHMVHTNNNPNVPNTAVVGVLFEYGAPDPFLSMIEKDIKVLNLHGGVIELGTLDPRRASLNGKRYYRYEGSLTTPPCTEGVIWTVKKKVNCVSCSQVELLKQTVVEERNSRPLQKINGRDVFLYDPYLIGRASE